MSRSGGERRKDRPLRVAAADDVLEIDGITLPLRPSRHVPRWIVVVAVLVGLGVGTTTLLIVPTRTWLSQRRQYADDLVKLDAVNAANARMEAQIEALQTPEEVERLARERYNLVKNGDQVVAVLPAPAPNPLPAAWPYTVIQDLVTVRLTYPDSIPATTVATKTGATPVTSTTGFASNG